MKENYHYHHFILKFFKLKNLKDSVVRLESLHSQL